jgi:hypothetical protein
MQSSSKGATIAVLVIVVLIIIGFFWWLTLPKNVPASSVTVVPSDILDKTETTDIQKRPVFGNIPISVSAQEKGRPNPFAKF